MIELQSVNKTTILRKTTHDSEITGCARGLFTAISILTCLGLPTVAHPVVYVEKHTEKWAGRYVGYGLLITRWHHSKIKKCQHYFYFRWHHSKIKKCQHCFYFDCKTLLFCLDFFKMESHELPHKMKLPIPNAFFVVV